MFNKLKLLLNRLIVALRIKKNQLPIFFFLLVLSSVFWVLIVLSKDYTTTVRYQATFVDLPKDKLLIDDKNVDLHLQVVAPGFTILANRLRYRKYIPLSVSSFIPKRKGNKWNYYWLGKQSISQLQDVLPTNMQLLNVQPNRIDVMLDEKAERVLPVQIKTDLSFKELFRQKEPIRLEPSTIVISGPKAVVEVFSSISTETLNIDNINDLQANINLEWDVDALPGLTVDARAAYTSKQYASADNSLEVDASNRFDLGVRYSFLAGMTDITLRARVDNVFDNNYWASVGGFPGSNYLVLSEPRTFRLSASFNF